MEEASAHNSRAITEEKELKRNGVSLRGDDPGAAVVTSTRAVYRRIFA